MRTVEARHGRAPLDVADLPTRLAASAAHVTRSAADIADWLDERRRSNPATVERVPFAELHGWGFAPGTGDLVHDTGRFFSVHGLRVRTDYGHRPEWEQPIINQQDVAILGIVAREIDGVLHFLMQAKMEPGNVNLVQLSPTVQATSSNYLRAHKGAPSRYVEYLVDRTRGRVLVDVLQSEQGSWFVGKRNRNVVVEAVGRVEPHDDFIWLTLGEIRSLLHLPHLVNMDARTVLACLPLEPPDDDGEGALLTMLEVRSWLTERKAVYALATDYVPLAAVAGWRRTADEIAHAERRYFTVVGVRVAASNREVRGWCQPLLAPCSTGLAAFVLRRIGGTPHVLARADLRPGYRDVIEVGPTVQCTPDNYAGRPADERPAYLDLVLSDGARRRFDVVHSEEGGRFHHALTRHLVVEVGEDFPLLAGPPDFVWLTLPQLGELASHSYQVDIEARSLLLCLRGPVSSPPRATSSSGS